MSDEELLQIQRTLDERGTLSWADGIRLLDEVGRLRKENADLRDDVSNMEYVAKGWEGHARGALAKLAKAVEGLRPFARAGELCEQSGAPAGAFLWTRSSNVPGEEHTEGISIADVVRARAVLKELEK